MSSLSNAKHKARLEKVLSRLDLTKSHKVFLDGPGCPAKDDWVKATKTTLDILVDAVNIGMQQTSKNLYKDLYLELENLYKRKDKLAEFIFHSFTILHVPCKIRIELRFVAGRSLFGLQKVLVTDLTENELANLEPFQESVVEYKEF